MITTTTTIHHQHHQHHQHRHQHRRPPSEPLRKAPWKRLTIVWSRSCSILHYKGEDQVRMTSFFPAAWARRWLRKTWGLDPSTFSMGSCGLGGISGTQTNRGTWPWTCHHSCALLRGMCLGCVHQLRDPRECHAANT